MSLSVAGLSLSRTISPEIDTGRTGKEWAVLQGAISSNHSEFNAELGGGLQIQFNVMNPPSPNIFISRRIWLRCTYMVTFVGVSAGAGIALLQMAGTRTAPGVSAGTQYYDAPRCMPLNNSIQTSKVMINQQSITDNTGQYFRILTRYHENKEEQDIYFGASTSMPDQSLEYSDLDGFPLNPLGAYGNSTQNPRGGLYDMIITENTSTGVADTATVEFTVFEPLTLSPFNWSSYNAENGIEQVGLYGVSTMQLQVNFGGRGNGPLGGLFGAIWSHSSLGSTLTSGTAAVVDGKLHVKYLTPPLVMKIPSEFTYSYSAFDYRPTSNTFAPMLAGAGADVNINAIQLGAVPTRFYVFACEVDGSTNALGTDSYLRITSLRIQIANSQILMSNMTEFDLYMMSVKNGLNMNWRQWQTMGSPICISVGIDLPLPDELMAPSLRKNIQLIIQASIVNQYGRTVTPALNVLLVQEGTILITEGKCTVNTGILNEGDVLASRTLPAVKYMRSTNVLGSGWFDKVKGFFKKAARTALDVVGATPFGQTPQFQAANSVAKAIGLGRYKGRGMIGGAALSTRQLKALKNKHGHEDYRHEQKYEDSDEE